MDYLRNMGLEPDEGFLQDALQQLTQTVVELDAARQIGAGRYERTPERKTYRNGHRDRVWETRVGEIPLRIPKVRDGSHFPRPLEPRRRSEKALLTVIQQAYVEGVSTRRVDDLLQALGLTGIDTPALAGGAIPTQVRTTPHGPRTAPRSPTRRGSIRRRNSGRPNSTSWMPTAATRGG